MSKAKYLDAVATYGWISSETRRPNLMHWTTDMPSYSSRTYPAPCGHCWPGLAILIKRGSCNGCSPEAKIKPLPPENTSVNSRYTDHKLSHKKTSKTFARYFLKTICDEILVAMFAAFYEALYTFRNKVLMIRLLLEARRMMKMPLLPATFKDSRQPMP